MHTLRKLISTTKICSTLFLARTFGKYQHSGWNGRFDYCSYLYRGKVWDIPTSAADEDGFY